MHSIRTAAPDAFLNACGALAGMFSVVRADRGGLATEREFKLALKQREQFLEIMAMRRRSSTSRHVHIDQAIAAGSFRPH